MVINLLNIFHNLCKNIFSFRRDRDAIKMENKRREGRAKFVVIAARVVLNGSTRFSMLRCHDKMAAMV